MNDHDGLDYDDDLFGDDDLFISDPVSEALKASADRLDDLRDADPEVLDSVSAFTGTAVAALRGIPTEEVWETFQRLVLCAFLAGRDHAAAGHPSPVAPDPDAPLYVPAAWC